MPCRVPGTTHPGWKEYVTADVGEGGERAIALSLHWKEETLVVGEDGEIELLVGAVDEEYMEEIVEAALMVENVGPEGEAASWIHLKSSMGRTFVL